MNQQQKEHKILMQLVEPLIGMPIIDLEGKKTGPGWVTAYVTRGAQSRALKSIDNAFRGRFGRWA